MLAVASAWQKVCKLANAKPRHAVSGRGIKIPFPDSAWAWDAYNERLNDEKHAASERRDQKSKSYASSPAKR